MGLTCADHACNLGYTIYKPFETMLSILIIQVLWTMKISLQVIGPFFPAPLIAYRFEPHVGLVYNRRILPSNLVQGRPLVAIDQITNISSNFCLTAQLLQDVYIRF